MPETQSQEKIDMLRLCGAEVRLVPAKPYRDPGNYVRLSERVAGELARTEPNGVVWANQWDNPANYRGHVESTGPEIWRQTGGRVDGFICASGTGGTLAGVSQSLRSCNKDVVIGLADPEGAAMYSYFKTGELASEGSSITEGIGQGRVTVNVAAAHVGHPLPDPRFGGRAGDLRPAVGGGAVPRRVERHQRRRGDPASPASSAPARPSSPCCATAGSATSRSSSTQTSCARRTSPSRPGSPRAGFLPMDAGRSAKERENPPFDTPPSGATQGEGRVSAGNRKPSSRVGPAGTVSRDAR